MTQGGKTDEGTVKKYDKRIIKGKGECIGRKENRQGQRNNKTKTERKKILKFEKKNKRKNK